MQLLGLTLYSIGYFFFIHFIIFYIKTTLKNFKKNLSSVLNTFENIMENGEFVPKEQMLPFSIIFSNT